MPTDDERDEEGMEAADPCNGCEGSCRICSDKYRHDPARFETWPSDEQMSYFVRGGR
jgi:hypothetical protein